MLELNLTPADIDKLVKESIMLSGFGEAVKTACVNTLTGYNSPIENEVRKYVAELTAQLLREKFSVQIKEAISAAIEASVTREIINKITESSVKQMIRAATSS